MTRYTIRLSRIDGTVTDYTIRARLVGSIPAHARLACRYRLGIETEYIGQDREGRTVLAELAPVAVGVVA